MWLFFQKHNYIFLTCLGVLFFLSPSFGYAISSGTLGGRPAYPDPALENSASWFLYTLAPGTEKEDEVILSNFQEYPLEALVYAADSSKSSDGGFALKQFLEMQTEVGSWVTFYPQDPPERFQNMFEDNGKSVLALCALSPDAIVRAEKGKKGMSVPTEEAFQALTRWCQGEKSFTARLDAKEEKRYRFVFRVPIMADVGEHTGGILIEKTVPNEQKIPGGSVVHLTTRIGVRIYQTVPGTIEKVLTLEKFQAIKNFSEFSWAWFGKDKKPEEYILSTTLQNHGNVSTEFQESIVVRDNIFGTRSETIENRKFQAMKQDQFVSSYAWQSPRFGWFSFSQEITYDDADGNRHTLNAETVTVWIFPWREIVMAFVLVFLSILGFVGRRLYLGRKYGGIGWETYRAKSGDTVNTLAQSAGVSWEMLAKTNALSAPYSIREGMSLLVPPNTIGQAGRTFPKNAASIFGLILPSKREDTSVSVTSFAHYTDDVEKAPKNNGTSLLKRKWIFDMFLGCCMLGSSLFIFFIVSHPSKTTITVQRTPAQEISPVASPKSEDTLVEKSDGQKEDTLLILNAGVKVGSAATLRIFLEGKDLKNIAIGNAPKTIGETKSTLFYAEGFQERAEYIRQILVDRYPMLVLKSMSECIGECDKSAQIIIVLTK